MSETSRSESGDPTEVAGAVEGVGEPVERPGERMPVSLKVNGEVCL